MYLPKASFNSYKSESLTKTHNSMNVQFGTFTQFIKNLELAQWCCALYNENAKGLMS